MVLKMNNSLTVDRYYTGDYKLANVIVRQSTLPLSITFTWSGMEFGGDGYAWTIDAFSGYNSSKSPKNDYLVDAPYNEYAYITFGLTGTGISYGDNIGGAPRLLIPSQSSGSVTIKIRPRSTIYFGGSQGYVFYWQPTSHGPLVAKNEKITASKMNDLKNYVLNPNIMKHIPELKDCTWDYPQISKPNPFFYPPVGDLIKYKHEDNYYYHQQNEDYLLADLGLLRPRRYMREDMPYNVPGLSNNQLDTQFKNQIINTSVFNCYDLYGKACPYPGSYNVVATYTL